MTISVIIPTLNEETVLARTLARTCELGFTEIVVADGGSVDATRAIVRNFDGSRPPEEHAACSIVAITAPPGRARQMNTGAGVSGGDILLFLHADTLLPDRARERIVETLQDSSYVGGRFDVRFDPPTPLGWVISTLMNLRSRLSGIATGDQAIFVRREVFEHMRGYSPIPLMEDLDLCRRLKPHGRVAALRDTVTTSYRRWARQGPWRTILLMWMLRFLYWLGVSPHSLARFYGAVR